MNCQVCSVPGPTASCCTGERRALQFCFTAKMGLWQHLAAGEIVDQVVQAQRWLRERQEQPVTNVVFMGMGEPLHNPDNVHAIN